MRQHVSLHQPADTIGQTVIYRCAGEEKFRHPHSADELNWAKPEIGRIAEFEIINPKKGLQKCTSRKKP